MLAELARIEAELRSRHQNPRFDPPWTTMSPTTIEGGTASNIVPPACSFQFGLRALPGLDPRGVMAELQGFADRELVPAMRKVSPEAGIEVRALHLTPPFQAEEGSEAVALAMRLAVRNKAYAVSYATEAAQFEDGRCPSVICGPGDIAQAHKPNEYIESAQLDSCMGFLERLGDWAAT
jgi:acetylornithine deacetylase